MATARVKPAMKRAQATADVARAARQKMLDEAASPGDTIEYSATVAMKTRKGDVWLKFGLTSTVRQDETGDDARVRVTDFVHMVLEEQATEYMKA